ncbi:Ankyrin repeat protein 2 [Giardia muris]|uniref:Ankyrin repeat protein 2 n=1 Tax=Giardia muris TaxID=5742 RepID=A0A4Z1SUW9_GIAMU|nr:Ankyrin repeat protein 2 [Giardia muris]|eukprot:TNJ29480.1 Ankyrin repeat protein 2 [Giardia muris]
MLAAKNGDVALVRSNLQDAKRRDNVGRTALMFAAGHGHPECVEVLRRHEENMRDDTGMTALMWASRHGRLECMQLLANEAGLQTLRQTTECPKGATALMLAAQWVHIDAVEYLLPLEKDILDENGNNAFHYAKFPARRIPNNTLLVFLGEVYGMAPNHRARPEPENNMCSICLEREKNMMFAPCNHLCVCDVCAPMLNMDCPICRQKAKRIERVFA